MLHQDVKPFCFLNEGYRSFHVLFCRQLHSIMETHTEAMYIWILNHTMKCINYEILRVDQGKTSALNLNGRSVKILAKQIQSFCKEIRLG